MKQERRLGLGGENERGKGKNEDKRDKERGLDRKKRGGGGESKRMRVESSIGCNWSPPFLVEIIRDSWADI